MMTQPQEDSRSFEKALAELEGCVRRLDSGELPLEESLQMFESGIALVRECQELLDTAERRVVELTRAPAQAGGVAERTQGQIG
jgi:exodeoxyribonuclease VII small subunit